MQWYKRWEKIRETFVALPPQERTAWWATWDTLGASPWDQHESGGTYNPEGSLFDLACRHDPGHLPHLLERPVAPDEQRDRQNLIDRACYEAWHRSDSRVFDHLAPLVQPWFAWLKRLGEGSPALKMMVPSSMGWIRDDGDLVHDEEALRGEDVSLLAITVSKPETRAWRLWSERYAHRPATQVALDHLWLGSSHGRVLDAMMIKVDDPAWALWALQGTTNPDRFCEGSAAPLVDTLVTRLAQAALPHASQRPSRPPDMAWFNGLLRKLDAVLDAWGLPTTFTEPLPLGMNMTGDLDAALPIWHGSGHPALAAMAALLESRSLARELGPIEGETSRPRPRL